MENQNMKVDAYETPYSSMERNRLGSWDVFNDVTGMLIREHVTYHEGRSILREQYNHYKSLE
jgi:hypothetical protein